MGWKFWESKKDEPAAPSPRKWIGSIKAEWANAASGKREYNVFNLFVDTAGKRSVELNGVDAAKHPIYLTKVYPWIQGAPDEILNGILDSADPGYWGALKTATKARKAPAKKAPKRS